jgi:two-component system, chemotaxis family, protein-glutamate methylesterase/glutaminase
VPPPISTHGHDIVVAGASAGGVEALRQLVEALPANLPAALFVVLHTPPGWTSRLPEILSNSGHLACRYARDGDSIEHGTLLIAPSDHHLMLKRGQVRLSGGPRENLWRPAIDVLFRSAAVAYGARVVGVVLSGALDDGTAGLRAIRRCGGTAIVQDPECASYPDMPKSALRNVEDARALSIGEIAAELARLACLPPAASPPVPADLLREAQAVESAGTRAQAIQIGDLTTHTCPGCGGPLSQQHGNPTRFRCLVGHAYSLDSLEEGTRHEIEASLWTAIRLLQQRSNLNRVQAELQQSKGRARVAESYLERAAESAAQAAALQQLVLSLPAPKSAPVSSQAKVGSQR